MQVVISQSMYFPWVGLLEQIRLADIFVHYDDVQFTRGFYNRVQVKTASGMRWLTIPLNNHHRGQNIDESLVDERTDWRSRHRDVLRQTYLNAPFRDEMLALVDGVFNEQVVTLADLSRLSMLALAQYFGLIDECRFIDSKVLGISGKSSQRLHDLVKALKGDVYITGHGARNYLDHELFENDGITVKYMDYQYNAYSQLYGAFTPYVTGLDLVANCGRDGVRVIKSKATNWRKFIHESD